MRKGGQFVLLLRNLASNCVQQSTFYTFTEKRVKSIAKKGVIFQLSRMLMMSSTTGSPEMSSMYLIHSISSASAQASKCPLIWSISSRSDSLSFYHSFNNSNNFIYFSNILSHFSTLFSIIFPQYRHF